MGGQFHDILPGTATPKAFEFAWNDDIIAMNQFASVLTSAIDAVASAMNTQTQGTPIVVYNPLNVEREDIVEAHIQFPNGIPGSVRVTGPEGKEVPAQVSGGNNETANGLLLPHVPSVGYAVFNLQPTKAPPSTSECTTSEPSLP